MLTQKFRFQFYRNGNNKLRLFSARKRTHFDVIERFFFFFVHDFVFFNVLCRSYERTAVWNYKIFNWKSCLCEKGTKIDQPDHSDEEWRTFHSDVQCDKIVNRFWVFLVFKRKAAKRNRLILKRMKKTTTIIQNWICDVVMHIFNELKAFTFSFCPFIDNFCILF